MPCQNYITSSAPLDKYQIYIYSKYNTFSADEKIYSKVHVTRTLSQKVERDTSVMCVGSEEMDVCVFLKDIS